MTAKGIDAPGATPGMAPGQRGLHPVGRALVRRGILSSRSLFEMEARVERAELGEDE